MNRLSIPIERQRIDETVLPEAVLDLVLNSTTPSHYICFRTDVFGVDSDWFLDFLDTGFLVSSLLMYNTNWYFGVSSQTPGCEGSVDLRVERVIEYDETIASRFLNMNGEVARILYLMFESLNTTDTHPPPFRFTGRNQTDVIDITRCSESARKKWSSSRVVLDSPGGDTLLVDNEQKVAWFQLETGNIIPVGNFVDAIKAYFLSAVRGVEFCSWNEW